MYDQVQTKYNTYYKHFEVFNYTDLVSKKKKKIDKDKETK